MIKLVQAFQHLHIRQADTVTGGDRLHSFPMALQITAKNSTRLHLARQPAAQDLALLPAAGRQLIVVFLAKTGLAMAYQIDGGHYRVLSRISRWQRFSR